MTETKQQTGRQTGRSLASLGLGLPPRRDELQAKAKQPKSMAELEQVSPSLARIMQPQAAYRWLMPHMAAITPQYIETVLRGALAGNHLQSFELFDLMLDSWPELAACGQELIEGVQRKQLIIEPYREEEEEPTDDAIHRAKVVSAAWRGMRPDAAADENDGRGTVRDILSGWLMGQVVLETDWQMIHSQKLGPIVAPRSTFWVHPACYAWSMEGRLGLRVELPELKAATKRLKGPNTNDRAASPLWNLGTHQARPSAVEDFPPDKFLVGIHKAKSGSALAGGLLRPLAWWWCAANFSADWLLNLAQIFGLPFRWANYQAGTPQATIDSICNMLERMGSAAWGAFPEGTQLEFKEASKAADNSPQGQLLDRADRYARTIILGQTLTGNSGTGKGGGMAFGKEEGGVKDDRIDAAGNYACDVLNLQLFPSILRLNFGDDTECPTARFLDDEEGGNEDAQRDAALVGAGLKIPTAFLYKKYRIPKPREEEETLGAMAVAVPAAGELDEAGNPKPQGQAAASADVQGTALNGAQVTALADLTEKVATGMLPLETAKAIAFAAFPLVPPATIERIFAALKNFEPKAAEVAPAPVAAAPKQDLNASSAAEPGEPKNKEILVAIAKDISPLLKRLQAIAEIQDEEILAKKLQEFLEESPQLKEDILADPALARALNPKLTKAFQEGLSGI